MNGLSANPRCPVCDEERRLPASMPDQTGRHYLKLAARRLGLTVDELVGRIQVYQCAACRSLYCDPWLDDDTAAGLFNHDHIAGWSNFEHRLSSDTPNDLQQANRRLFEALRSRLGDVRAYAEFGCPFQGFLLDFAGADRLDRFTNAALREEDVRWTPGAKLHHLLSAPATAAVLVYHRLRAWKKGSGAAALPAPERRALLTRDTVHGWGGNCVRYGGSCRYYAHRVLGAEVLPLERGGQYDLIGIFNNLDHTDDPVGVLKRALELSPRVVVVTHHASQAGKQHHYAFDEDFPKWLATALPGVKAEDLTDEVTPGRRDNNYTLLTSVRRPAPAGTTSGTR